MATSTMVAPPNSLVLVSDFGDVDIPKGMGGALIASTSSCIAIGCQSEIDGETTFTLGAVREVDPGYAPVFQGLLMTPNRRIAVRSVTGKAILQASVIKSQTAVRVWVNGAKEPDQVIVGFG